jgi:predicted outer membrane protein
MTVLFGSLRRNLVLGLTVALSIALGSLAWAQQSTERSQRSAQTSQEYGQASQPSDLQSRQAGQPGAADRFVAGMLGNANKQQIEISRHAAEKTQNDRVKEYAQKIIEEHEEFGQKLEQFAGATSEGRGGLLRQRLRDRQDVQTQESSEEQAQSSPQEEPVAGRTARGGRAGRFSQSGFDPVNIGQQICERTTQLFQQEMDQYQGVKFDQVFIGQQCVAHLHMKGALEVLKDQEQISPELQELLATTTQTVDQHFQQAKQLWDQLSPESTRAAERPGSTPLQQR